MKENREMMWVVGRRKDGGGRIEEKGGAGRSPSGFI